ncbi:MAG: DUF3021 domain-containing protein [Oscillospiraceae bacterium]|nr:DUF3021 domain-containing protein [Oscillospiraceae bacterium]
MRFITDLIRYFVYITTGILFVFIVVLLIKGIDSISIQKLIQIPCAALITALITVIFSICSRETSTKKEFYIGIAIHYILLCAAMVFFGTTFGWVNFDLEGVMIIVISTAAIYAFTFVGAYLSSKNDAKKLNEALRSKREQKK